MKKSTLTLPMFGAIFMVFSTTIFSSIGLIHIGSERKIFMNCQGKGSPTVFLISGYPDRGDASWETLPSGKKELTVFEKVSKFTKVCDYDRPGTIMITGNKVIKSRSNPVQQPVTAKTQVNDLHDLVKAAKIDKPFILVAHSAGGLIARLYAFTYPEDVSGIILIDVTNEKLLKTWTKKEIEVFYFSGKKGAKELIPHYKNVEVIDFGKSFQQLEYYQDQKLHIPAVILTEGEIPNAKGLIKNGLWPGFATQKMAESIINGIHRSNDLLAETFVPIAKRINIKNSGHYIQKEQPELIIDLIRTMVRQQKSRK